MGNKPKYYVVWEGLNPGIYTTWAECELQVKGVPGAVFKSFETREEADRALADPETYVTPRGRKSRATAEQTDDSKQQSSSQSAVDPAHPNAVFNLPPAVIPNALAVDAACSGNPGKMEYQGVYVATGQRIFHFGPMYGTNNIGEFLAIVHGLALLKQKNLDLPLYSDSVNAIKWVKTKKCKTQLERNARSEQLFQLIERAEKWLHENTYTTRILKWETKQWGEVPADFGRK